jgi:hypothetical protein
MINWAIAAPPIHQPQQAVSNVFTPRNVNFVSREVFACGKSRSQNWT